MVIDGRVPRRPGEPTARQKEVHEATHQPFAPWCQACVMSRSREDSHIPSACGEEQDGAEAGSVAQIFMFPKDYEVPKSKRRRWKSALFWLLQTNGHMQSWHQLQSRRRCKLSEAYQGPV